MATRLTKKQKGFIKDYSETGNGTLAALKNYDTTDENTAAVIASENLRKPHISQALGLDDESLEAKHIQLLNQKRLDYFIFSKHFADEEIVRMVEEDTGIKIINVRSTEKGKMAWYATDDSMAQDKALDKAYKLRGKYAPDKHVTVNIDVEANEEIKSLAAQLNALHRGTGVGGNGIAPGTLDQEA